MISVCIATYNGEKYIKKQLDSIIRQLGDGDEVVISDDHSTDNTVNIIRGYNDDRIKIFFNEGEKGYTSNFENALQQAAGDYIFLSDQDDLWADEKVPVCMEMFRKYDMIISDAQIIDENGVFADTSFFSIRKPYKSAIGNIYKFGYIGCCFAFKKKVLGKAMPFPANRKLCSHDNWLALVGMFFFKTKITSQKLVYYRRHQHNVSSGAAKTSTSVFFMIHYRLYLIMSLIKKIFKNS